MPTPDDRVPDEIAYEELLVRFFERGHVRSSDRAAKWQGFCSTKHPFQISVSRDQYHDTASRAGDEGKLRVGVIAGEVRSALAYARVLAAKPPPEHAHIECHPDGGDSGAVQSKQELQQHAELYDRHIDTCKQLAKISTVIDA